MSVDLAVLRVRFKELGLERLRTLNETVLALEAGGGGESLVDQVMREVHTLKGESRMLGLGALNRVAHCTEDLLLYTKRAGRFEDADWIQHVYAGFDLLAALLQEVGQADTSADDPRAATFADDAAALLLAEGEESGPVAASTSSPAPDAPATGPVPEDAEAPTGLGTLRVRRSTIDEITRTAGEVGILQAHLRQFAEDATQVHQRVRDDLARRHAAGEDVENLRAIATELDRVLRTMRDMGFDASIRQNRLQDAVERMRLSSVATLFERFPRTIRDLAADLGREARLLISGREVGADQQVLDLLADPLLHLIRNAIDHGLEQPETREAEGKPRRGTVRLGARQAGRFIEILVGDDGRGIDTAAVAQSAIGKGLLSEADVARMSEQELLQQILRPAFSTRTAVSDVSGRGVGLDVVKRAIDDLGGSIRIESQPGHGTTFVLRLPVSIALVDALVLDLGNALYAIPTAYVEHILEVDPHAVEKAGGRDVVQVPDSGSVSLVDLGRSLGLAGDAPEPGALLRVVVVVEGERRLALRVPGFVGELSLVQEALDPFLRGLRLVTGTAMLDGGRRVVMLNGAHLVELSDVPPASGPEITAKDVDSPRTVLLIEDSDLTRSMLGAALADAGWRVLEAVNGRVGLEQFAAHAPDVVITDLEMPQVDGWAVIEQIRRDAAPVPIVVLSTIADDAAKARAARLGVDAYLHKSSFAANELLGLLGRLVADDGGNK